MGHEPHDDLEHDVRASPAAIRKKLELVGVGYRAAMKGASLSLALGYSARYRFPDPRPASRSRRRSRRKSSLRGIDKQLVGETAAKIRSMRPPEPFQGKGVRYEDEYIFRKEGKKK